MSHEYLPISFIDASIIPPVENKSGNRTEINNYRVITISNACSKLLEVLLLEQLHDTVVTDDHYQFGFKHKQSTCLCTISLFKDTVDCCRRNGSHAFACFTDFNKAFDKVDYWLLTSKLANSVTTDSQLCCEKIITFWFTNQFMHICWQNMITDIFQIYSSVPHEGILPHFCFLTYMILHFLTYMISSSPLIV